MDTDTLKGFVYLETFDGLDYWCLAVEDPNNRDYSRILKCVGEKSPKGGRTLGRKRNGPWIFKAFRFEGKIKEVRVIKKSISQIIPEFDQFQEIQVTELRKLKEWTD